MIKVFKIIRSLLQYFCRFLYNSGLRGYYLKLYKKRCISNKLVNLVLRIELWSTGITYRSTLSQAIQSTHLRIAMIVSLRICQGLI